MKFFELACHRLCEENKLLRDTIAVLSAEVSNPMPDGLDQMSYPNLFAFMWALLDSHELKAITSKLRLKLISLSIKVNPPLPPYTAAQPHLTHRHQVLCCRNWKQF